MKILILLILLTQATAVMANRSCQLLGEKQYNSLVEEMIVSGKGRREINEIMAARMDWCRGQCPPIVGMGVCVLVIPEKDKENGQ